MLLVNMDLRKTLAFAIEISVGQDVLSNKDGGSLWCKLPDEVQDKLTLTVAKAINRKLSYLPISDLPFLDVTIAKAIVDYEHSVPQYYTQLNWADSKTLSMMYSANVLKEDDQERRYIDTVQLLSWVNNLK